MVCMKRSHNRKVQKVLHKIWLVAVAMQALWMLVLYSGWVVNSGVLNQYLNFIGASRDVSTASYELPSVVAKPLVVIVVVAVVLIIAMIMARAPKTAARVTVRATTEATKRVEPMVRHAMPKKSVQSNSWYITPFSQVLLCSLVCGATIPVHFVTEGIRTPVIWTITLSLWGAAIGLLLVSVLVHRMSRST